MLDNNFTVKFTNAHNCFLTISEANERKLAFQKVVKVKYGYKEIYCSCVSSPFISDNNVVGIPSAYAKDLGIREKEKIYMTDVSRVPSLTKITVTPTSPDDYEVLDLCSDTIQNTLLDQIRVVNVNQKLSIWTSKWLSATVKIEEAEPFRFGYLNNLTEVHVMHLHQLKPSKEKTEKVEKKIIKRNLSSNMELEILERYIKQNPVNIFRVQSLSIPQNLTENDMIATHPFNVFIYENSVPNILEDINGLALFRLKLVEPPVDYRNGEEKHEASCDVVVQVCLIERYYNSFSDDLKSCFTENTHHRKYPLIFVPSNSLEPLNLVTGSKVTLCKYTDIPIDVRCVEVLVSDTMCKNASQIFKSFIADRVKYSKCLINAEVSFKVENLFLAVKFSPKTVFCVFNEHVLRNCKVYGNIDATHVFPTKAGFTDEFIDTTKLCCEIDELKKIVRETETLLKIKNHNENVLITGRSGCGKSTVVKIISENVCKYSPYFYKLYINCKRLKGKSVENLQKSFTQDFKNLTYYQPSLLILDDLDVLCKKTDSGPDSKTQDAVYSNRISEMLAELIGQYQKRNRISILATCQSYFEINDIIVSPRGQHIFKNFYEMPQLSKHHRFLILKKLFTDRKVVTESLDIEELSVKTEGFVVQDLLDFVDRCLFEHHKRNSDSPQPIHLNALDIENALNSIMPLSLQCIQFHSSNKSDSSISLDDIGGLTEAKARLMENISWPGKYPELFGGVDGMGDCPVRYARGTLLFGPPGVGKTALVGAIARECQIRLIVVNGPELLSKYVGESERAVRAIFEKARRAKPCLLFFDEFESAASRRGKDSTGVTDRVVNQLLVQLDGVESNSGGDGAAGVYVVAATSRPDLVDPALLRPGRLGLRVLCPVPDQQTRLTIIKALSKRLNLAKGVDLENLATKTDGYTGADIQAILYTAQLLAVEEAILASQGNPIEAVEITQKHMSHALSTTEPSLTLAEIEKYDKIYAKFQSNKDVSDVVSSMKKQKQILA